MTLESAPDEPALELRRYLAPLAPHGSGMRRQSGITVTQLAPDQYRVGHPVLGSYRLILDDLQELSRTGPGHASLEEDPWEITHPQDPDKPLRISVYRNMFLPASAIFTAAAIRLEIDPAVYPPGACRVCGGTKIRVRLPLYFDVEMVGEGVATWDGQGSFDSHLSLAHCADCKTEHPINGWLNFQGSINGCRFGDRKHPELWPEPGKGMTLKNLLSAVPNPAPPS